MKQLSIILFCLGLAVIWPGDSFGGKKNMDILLKNINDKDKLPKLEPAKYELAEAGLTHGEEIWNIFQVPRDNSIGTNDLNNAITLLKFKGDKMELEMVRKNFLKEVGGGDQIFLEPLSKDEIGYSQTRRFVIFNLKTKEFKRFRICESLEEQITGVYPIDARKMIFLFEIEYSTMQMEGVEHYFRVLDLSGREIKLVRDQSSVEIPLDFQSGILFQHKNGLMSSMDMNFRAVEHVFVSYFNKNRDKIGGLTKELTVHSYYPFAVFSTVDKKNNDNGLWLITWKDKTYPELIYVAEKKPDHDWKNIQFSPDGKWLVLIDKHDDANTDYYAVPIDKQNVVYLGLTPIYLGTIAFPINSTWIAKPQSFVVTTGKELYKWELDDRALKMIPKR